MNLVLKKNQLPNFQKIEHLSFDIEKLKEDCNHLKNEFTSVYEANKELILLHKKLAYKLNNTNSYKEAPLTIYSGNEETSLTSIDHLSVKEKIDFKNSRSPLNEHMYNQPSPAFKTTYIFEKLNVFRSPVTRVRLACLAPKAIVDWHIDYDPTYAVRLIIPIYTNPAVRYLVNRRGHIESKSFPADGSAYFLNTGFPHRVENAGSEDRIVLLISINGQKDIEPYRISKT